MPWHAVRLDLHPRPLALCAVVECRGQLRGHRQPLTTVQCPEPAVELCLECTEETATTGVQKAQKVATAEAQATLNLRTSGDCDGLDDDGGCVVIACDGRQGLRVVQASASKDVKWVSCWDPPVWHRVQDDSVAERQPCACGWCVLSRPSGGTHAVHRTQFVVFPRLIFS